MSEALQPVVDFLSRTAPFDQMDSLGLMDLASRLEIEYQRRGSELRLLGTPAERLYIVRSGALSETDKAALLVSRYAEGEVAGVEDLLTGQPSRTSLRASEDSLLYTISRSRFEELLSRYATLARSFTASVSERLRQASLDLAKAEPALGSTTVPVDTLLTRSLVAVGTHCSIREAARMMSEHRVSALAITGGDVLGIVTDRDLRNRVVAVGRSTADPVAAVMTSPALTVDKRALVFDALLLMLERGIHHLVVTDHEHPIGIITTTDLIRAHSENPILVVGEVNKQTTIEGLARANQRREQVLVRLIASGARAADVHRVLTGIGDAVVRRLLQLAGPELEKRGLGPVPPHCFLVFGSQARSELALGSDQDNGLVLQAGVSADDPAAAFLAEWVCEGLAICGYPKCNGEIMASVPRWRQPLEIWQSYFRKWIQTPEKEAVMRASIFFDMRAISGDVGLVSELKEVICTEVARQPVFLAHMARDAMVRQPPLGLFRQFVVEKEGAHADTVDLKHRGVIPIVDLARVLALEAGYTGPNTLDRLVEAQRGGTLSSSGCSDLSGALEFIALLRLQHQAKMLRQGDPPSSFLRPDELSSADRRHLRDAFQVIKTLQQSLQMSHQLGALAQ